MGQRTNIWGNFQMLISQARSKLFGSLNLGSQELSSGHVDVCVLSYQVFYFGDI